MIVDLRKAVVAAVTMGLLAIGGDAEAQSSGPLWIEARVGVAVPRGALAERWGAGIGIGVNAALRLAPSYSVYAGYSRTTFDLDPLDDTRAVDSGISAGLTRTFPLSGTAVLPWVRSGVLVHSLATEGGARTRDGGRPGFEVGGGITVPSPRGPALRMDLGVGYRRYSARVLGPDREPVTYLSAGVGLVLAL